MTFLAAPKPPLEPIYYGRTPVHKHNGASQRWVNARLALSSHSRAQYVERVCGDCGYRSRKPTPDQCHCRRQLQSEQIQLLTQQLKLAEPHGVLGGFLGQPSNQNDQPRESTKESQPFATKDWLKKWF
jgi:hypothetical protein